MNDQKYKINWDKANKLVDLSKIPFEEAKKLLGNKNLTEDMHLRMMTLINLDTDFIAFIAVYLKKDLFTFEELHEKIMECSLAHKKEKKLLTNINPQEIVKEIEKRIQKGLSLGYFEKVGAE